MVEGKYVVMKVSKTRVVLKTGVKTRCLTICGKDLEKILSKN